MTLRRFLMIQCDVFLEYHLINNRRIDIFDSDRVRVDGLGDAL